MKACLLLSCFSFLWDKHPVSLGLSYLVVAVQAGFLGWVCWQQVYDLYSNLLHTWSLSLWHRPACLSSALWHTAVFCPFTHTQTRASLTREWFEDQWSGINGNVSRVQHWYSLPSLSLSSLNWYSNNVKMSSERYCFSELEKDISLEMLALHKRLWNVKNLFRSIN